jgi:diaminopimelate epimerase
MFNADGSEAEMCGNGIRCVGKYAFDHGISRSNPMRVQTASGVLSLALQIEGGKVSGATVNMGRPILKLAEIPVDESKISATGKPQQYSLDIGGQTISPATFVSMGNPHAVIFIDDPKRVDLSRFGPLIERHPAFPRRVNVHWVQMISPGEVTMQTWERGSGITLACGTGACAVCVAGSLTGRTGRKILAHLPGGDLSLEWRESDDCVYMTGPATEVFSGDWPR